MIIDRNITEYIVYVDDTIRQALTKIARARSMIIMAVDQRGILHGLFTNGDFMRWVIEQETVDLNLPVTQLLKKEYICATEDTPPEKVEEYLKTIFYVPVVDPQGHLVAVARRRDNTIRIENRIIGKDAPTFIIAEIGNNHNGDLTLAKHLIDLAVDSGADCVKFQMRRLSSLYVNMGDPNDDRENLNSQYTLDLLSRFQLSDADMFEAFDHCRTRGVLPLCTPWDQESLEALESYGMPAYKVASADLTNPDLLIAIARTGKPMICSTGMSTEKEIEEAADLLERLGTQFALLHCNSTYPAPFKDLNLQYIQHLCERFNLPIGYSGHERGINVAVAAVTMGARIIEKHFTIDRNMEGSDHKVSLLPDEFKEMVQGIRDVEMALGTPAPRQLTQGEIINRANLAKSLTINCDLRRGKVIEDHMIEVKSPGRGLQPNRRSDLVGRIALHDFRAGDFFHLSDLDDSVITARHYHFERPWGIPVRYHDFEAMVKKTNLDLLEFHLSYKDMEKDISQYFNQPFDLDLVVHSPELFANDHLMNLCAEDEDYRNHSIQKLQDVVNITRALKPYFTRADRPLIIINAGGYSRSGFVAQEYRDHLYEQVANAIAQVDTEGVEIIPQTYPPFPWLFGGQYYHNLFLDAKSIVQFCRSHNFRVCLDVSHSKLACNHFGWSFKEFLTEVAPYAAHLHIVDAKGVDGEGLQIGEGEIDFVALAEYLNQGAPYASFVPEIWQGHEDDGRGFWTALEQLEIHFRSAKDKMKS